MFFRHRRVEEDLEKIRRANLPAEKLSQELAEEESARQAARENLEGITAKDILAMIIAVFSLILPYILTFVVVIWAVLSLLGIRFF